MPEKYTLEILGQKFDLATTDGKMSDLVKVANYYKNIIEKVNNLQPNRPHLEIAVLAGLMVTDDLYNMVRSRGDKESSSGSKGQDKKRKEIDEILNKAIKDLEISLSL